MLLLDRNHTAINIIIIENQDGSTTLYYGGIRIPLRSPLIHIFNHPRRVHVFRRKTLDEGGY